MIFHTTFQTLNHSYLCLNGRGPTCECILCCRHRQDQTGQEFTAELDGRAKSVFTPEFSPESRMIVQIHKDLDETFTCQQSSSRRIPHVCHKNTITGRLVSSFNREKQKVHEKEEVVIVDVRKRRRERKNPFFFVHRQSTISSVCLILLFYRPAASFHTCSRLLQVFTGLSSLSQLLFYSLNC